jgi:hypothetical protein
MLRAVMGASHWGSNLIHNFSNHQASLTSEVSVAMCYCTLSTS